MGLVNLDTHAMYSYDETGKPGCPRNVHLYYKKDQRLQYKTKLYLDKA